MSETRVGNVVVDVDNRFKFSIVSVKKEKAADKDVTFHAKFYLHNPTELHTKPIEYSQKMVKKFSPENLSIMEFRTQKDYRLCSKIRGDHKLIKELGLIFRREFHMADDSYLFKKSSENNNVLFEGKMIYQYTSEFSEERFYIDKHDARKELLKKMS